MASRVLIVGSGAIGLRTALDLLRRNVAVTLRAPFPPSHPTTCSMGAGGLWMPYHCDDPRTNRWALETLDVLLNEAGGESSLVESVDTVLLKRSHGGPSVKDYVLSELDGTTDGWNSSSMPLPEWTKDPRLHFQHMTAEMLSWQNQLFRLRIPSESALVQMGYLYAWHFKPPVVDAPRMLDHMLEQVKSHQKAVDVNVETGHYYSSVQEMVDDAVELECDAVVNCTGLGASTICNDTSLLGARGVTLHYDRTMSKRSLLVHEKTGEELVNDAAILTEDAPLGSETEPCYLIPRGKTMVVGGSYLEGEISSTIHPSERERLVRNARALGIDTDLTLPTADWVGFRPARSTVRCEADESFGSVKVVHNYGHGGSGWTVYVGAAAEALRLLGYSQPTNSLV